MRELFVDTETRSPVNLFTGDLAKYATQVEVTIVTWALDDAKPQCWDVTRGLDLPAKLTADIAAADVFVAHNAQFDYTVLNATPWCPAEFKDLTRWRCTMAQAYSHGLPGALDKLCAIFKVSADESKLDGVNYINLFCKPNKAGGYSDRTSHPEEWKGFLQYATRDIPAMRAVRRAMPAWNSSEYELALWQLDQQINRRGFAVDVEFAEAAVRATTEEKKRLSDRTSELTEGSVDRTTQRDRLLCYMLAEHAVALPDLKTDTVERRLDDPELPEQVKELLRIRLQASKSSTSKYKRVLQREVGGRMYFSMQYCGANRTGRWSGKGFQPHNLARPSHKQSEIDAFIDACKAGAEDLMYGGEIMPLASSSLRGVIIASPGKKLVVSDLSNIEGRILAWMAGEEWKVQAFRDFDDGVGHDLYTLAYARAFGIAPEVVTKEGRQVGKVMELALGYGGGVGAFCAMAVTYGLDLPELAEKAWPTIPDSYRRRSKEAWTRAKLLVNTFDLDEQVYVVCDALKLMWRDAHPETTTLWKACGNAASDAVLNPGIQFKVSDNLVFERRKAWLRVRLPSGRYLCYPDVRINGDQISYMGVNVYSKKWHRINTYSGKLVENTIQAAARDALADGMLRAEENGYHIVLSVHDELVTECPDSDEFNDDFLSAILATNSAWNEGLPLAAKGFTAYRYRKD